MQAIEIRQAAGNVAAERLQSAAGVAGAVAQHGATHRIGDARLKFLEPARLAANALAGDESDARLARFQCADKRRNKSGIVLPVAVERRHNGGARGRNTRAHRRRLAAGLLVAHAAQPGMLRHQPFQLGLGAVSRSVIDVDDLEGPLPIERFGDFRDKRRNIAGLVADRHHNGYRRIGCIHAAMSYGAQKPAGNRFDALKRGSRELMDLPSGPIEKPSPRSAK